MNLHECMLALCDTVVAAAYTRLHWPLRTLYLWENPKQLHSWPYTNIVLGYRNTLDSAALC